jgi:predicted Rossmann fold flavoprotein
MNTKSDILWDCIVIGGGPAGMMAAGRLAERGARVLLLEKNDTLGKKLLITGGGRCNLTNAEFDTKKFLHHFKKSGTFLFSPFSKWAVKETLDFFHERNMNTKIEAFGRVFPESNRSVSVWNVLVEYMKKYKVTVQSNSPVADFIVEEKKIKGVLLQNNTKIFAQHIICATGGKSHPETGSTGDGFLWLEKIGHTIVSPHASLVPITTHDTWIPRLSGVTLPDVKVSLFQYEKKQTSTRGRVLFTHTGLSGPLILNMSKDIGELLGYGEVVLSLDIFPDLDYGNINQKLQELFAEHINKKIKNSLTSFVLPALVPILLDLTHIDPETPSHSITREQRIAICNILKAIPVNAKGLLGTEKAIITSGGVSLNEIDFKTMQSTLYPNLSIVGDLLNIDRPSGGYSLQLCWTTGFVAGDSVPLN